MEKRIFTAVLISIGFLWLWAWAAPKLMPEYFKPPVKATPTKPAPTPTTTPAPTREPAPASAPPPAPPHRAPPLRPSLRDPGRGAVLFPPKAFFAEERRPRRAGKGGGADPHRLPL